MRSGKDIKDKLCDEYKSIVDENKSYENLAQLVKGKLKEFKAEDILYWVTVSADWIGKDEENEKKVIDALNHILDFYRAPNGKILRIEKLGENTYQEILIHMQGYHPKKMQHIVERFLDGIS